jgi:hypothetical protein
LAGGSLGEECQRAEPAHVVTIEDSITCGMPAATFTGHTQGMDVTITSLSHSIDATGATLQPASYADESCASQDCWKQSRAGSEQTYGDSDRKWKQSRAGSCSDPIDAEALASRLESVAMGEGGGDAVIVEGGAHAEVRLGHVPRRQEGAIQVTGDGAQRSESRFRGEEGMQGSGIAGTGEGGAWRAEKTLLQTVLEPAPDARYDCPL